jgi:hypothetical protein
MLSFGGEGRVLHRKMLPFDRLTCSLEGQKPFGGERLKKAVSVWLSFREKAMLGDNLKNPPSNPHTPYVL